MAILIPTREDPRYSIEIELDGSSFFLDFEWNDRAESWFLDILNADRVMLLAGVRVVVGFPLINRYRDPRLPKGDLTAIVTSGSDLDPKFTDLGDRVQLLYTPIDEMNEALKVTL